MVIGSSDLGTVQCEDIGHQGPPACAEGQICLGNVCTDCAVAGTCGPGAGGTGQAGSGGIGEGGFSGQGGEPSQGGTAGSAQAGSGGIEAGPDTSVGGTSGAGGTPPAGGSGGDLPDGAPDIVDAPAADTTPVLKPIGDACAQDTECASNYCAQKAGPQQSMACTKACCASSDCPSGFICAPRNSYAICVSDKNSPGPVVVAGKVGEGCSADNQCATLRCRGGTCTDSCCVNADCGNKACAYEWGTLGWLCTKKDQGTLGTDGDSCSGDGACDSNICSLKCGGPCCSNDDCDGRFCQITNELTSGGLKDVRRCTLAPTDFEPLCCSDDNCPGQKCLPVAVGSSWVLRCK
jgi:hypothetical protein